MSTSPTTELEKIEPNFLKSILTRSLLAVAIAAPVLTGVGEVSQHLKREYAQETTLRAIDHLVPQSIHDITTASETAPTDLALLKDAIQAKRDSMDRVVEEVGMAGKLLGWDEGARDRSAAYSQHMENVQEKIDEITRNGWQPTDYMKNRSADQEASDRRYVEFATNLYNQMIQTEFKQIRSR